MAALTAEFGTVSGDPRLRGRAHEGRSSVFKCRGYPGGRMARIPMISDDRAHRELRCVKRRARAISAARLNGSPRLQLRPIDQVFCLGPYQKGELISETASHLDAFSGYPFRA